MKRSMMLAVAVLAVIVARVGQAKADLVTVGFAYNLSNSTYTTVNIPGSSWTSANGVSNATVVGAYGLPEPSTLTLASLSALSLLGYGWRKRKQTACRACC